MLSENRPPIHTMEAEHNQSKESTGLRSLLGDYWAELYRFIVLIHSGTVMKK